MPKPGSPGGADGDLRGPETPVYWSQPIPRIPNRALGRELVSCVFNGTRMFAAARKLPVATRLLAFPNALHPQRVMAIIVILVDGADDGRGVHHRHLQLTGAPNKPVVPPSAPDGQ